MENSNTGLLPSYNAENYRQDDFNSEMYKFEWEKEFFEKFEWLNDASKYEQQYRDLLNTMHTVSNKSKMQQTAAFLKNYLININDYQKNNSESVTLFLYYISLENDKMFLHATSAKPNEEIMKECENTFDYVKLNKPKSI
jgi:hypothetical protein